VLDTAVGYEGGHTENPSYEDVCSGTTGHAEVTQVTFDPDQVSYEEVCSHRTGHAEVVEVTFDTDRVSFEQLLEVFWAMHDPTQVNRQGPDVGDQYRSVIFTSTDEQRAAAEASRARAQERFSRPIATEIAAAPTFYPAEDYHQRWYAKKGGSPYCHTLPVQTLREQGLLPAASA